MGYARRAHPPLPGLDAQGYRLGRADVADAAGRVLAAAGIFGNHRFHHSRSDDLRCVSGTLVRPVSEALQRALAEILT